jgi:hypothetical protein
VNEPTVNTSNVPSTSLSAQTIACLAFFERWETPLDQEAAECYLRVRHEAPDFATFQHLAPAGSAERTLFERFLASFEEAGQLIRAGQMRADLFFDSWYQLPAVWHRVQRYVQGLRAEQSNPHLYESFEWLATRAAQFWEEREQTPPQWHPITTPEPTTDDQAIFAAFNQHSFPAPDQPGWTLFAQLQQKGPNYEAFAQLVPLHSPAFVTFDWLMCAYDRAGVLTKNGIIHPALLFATWRSPAEVWQAAEGWVKGLQHALKSPQLWENAEWLATFENEWRKR